MPDEEDSTKSSPLARGSHKDPGLKDDRTPGFLGVPLESSFRHSIDTLSDVSNYTADNGNDLRLGRLLGNGSARPNATSAASIKTLTDHSAAFWARNRGLALVVLAQLFGSLMNAATRILETEGSHGPGMHPFQILFARMLITLVFSLIYLYWAKIPHAPFGQKEVRGLLMARGFGGFFGVSGLYCELHLWVEYLPKSIKEKLIFLDSLQYLPIAEATVITFLAPTVACFACYVLIGETFTRSQQVAGLVSLLGVVLIAQPTSLFPGASEIQPQSASGVDSSTTSINITALPGANKPWEATLSQRFTAIGMALVGVCGAACAYTTIRWIGKRAHPLISVTYFAVLCLIVSTISLLFNSNYSFRLPSNVQEWLLLILLGICGFALQFLLTAGLAHEKSSRATNMIYTQILFALAFDKLIFDTTPGVGSLVGSGMVLGSALYVAVHEEKVKKKTSDMETGSADEVGLMVEGIENGGSSAGNH